MSECVRAVCAYVSEFAFAHSGNRQKPQGATHFYEPSRVLAAAVEGPVPHVFEHTRSTRQYTEPAENTHKHTLTYMHHHGCGRLLVEGPVPHIFE